ncbi:hypothetical protein KSP40_PGU011380 [Platanthera guangdongensis]|uniref:ZZ-type domain-containing protein n=1 Tax=Platanthera guangdongensis TaxID=2320717 RepID=A0ABR2LCU0_9ASPA
MIIEYDMNQLRAKIANIFNFSHDAVLIFTYTDEDGDIVSLDRDEELHDAVITQRLNPLKINVQIKPYPTGGSHSSSIPAESSDIESISTGFPQLSTELNSAVNKSLKSLPEPIRGPLSNISHDVLQIASSAPGFSDILSLLSKMHLVQSSNSHIHKSTDTSSGIPSSEVDLNTGDEPKVSNNSENQSPTVVPGPNSVSKVTENIQKMRESGHLNEPLGSINLTSEDLDLRIGKSAVAEEPPSTLFGTQTSNPINGISNTFPFAATLECPFSATSLDFPTYQGDDVSGNSGASPLAVPRPFIPPPIASSGSQSNATGSGTGFPTLFSHPPMLMHPYGRSPTCPFHMPRTFHQGVICDGCGMNPILGPRYKSTVKENYDLCATCFRDIGTETEYTRIDSSFRFPKSKDHQKHHHSRAVSKIMYHNRMKVRAPRGPKLESSFVVDVTVWDGTFVRHNSRFTKIWRMRNSGTIAWPSGTRLVWVGGDCLGIHTAAELEIPAMGFPVDHELDIAVDCLAPSVLGRFISYWQLVSPFGQNFGEEVWIIIQVCDAEAALPASILNQNLPPKSGPVVVDVHAKPLGFSPSPADESLGEVLKPAAPYLSNLLPVDVTSVPRPADNGSAPSLMEEIPASSSPDSNPSTVDVQAPLSPIMYPLVDISALPNSLDIDYAPSDALTNENMVELTLLKELKEMGFMQTDLNKDILRQNRYDLEQSVEELCEFAEWDPLLKELQEMGFNDRELNRKLLSKNEGSIKRVVLELVSGEKAA